MKKKLILSAFTCALLFSLPSCSKSDSKEEGKKEVDTQLPAKQYLYSIMKDIYYWNTAVPTTVSTSNIDIFDYFDKLLVAQDRWSWMETGSDYNKSETGIYTSYGASLGQAIDYYKDYNVKVRYVHKDSPFDKAGVTRGWTIYKINGEKVSDILNQTDGSSKFNTAFSHSPNTFTFLDLNNKEVVKEITATEISTRSVLLSKVFTSNDYPSLPHPVGYMVYLTFNQNMLADIDNAMSQFNQAGIKDLILDLRYNGGGNTKASDRLANYLAPASAEGGLFVQQKHNSNYSAMDNQSSSKSYIKRMSNALNLTRLYIITGKGTASASEIMINCLAPYMNVITVGNTTYGKPNGMYVLSYPENDYANAQYIFLPICFYSLNKEGKGFYENGIDPTQYWPDDYYHDFGVNEDLVSNCLQHIATGTFPVLKTASVASKAVTPPASTIITDEEKEHYGLYTIIPKK